MNITVTISGEFYHSSASIEISDVLYRTIATPVKTGDVPELILAGEEMSTESAEAVLRIRRNAARNIANAVTRKLMDELGKNDTHNGYKLEEEE